MSEAAGAWQKQGRPKQHGRDSGPTRRDMRIEVGLVHPVWEAGEEIPLPEHLERLSSCYLAF